MSLNLILPFVSTAVMLVFIIFVFQKYFASRRLEFLFWGIGLTFFGLGSFAEAYLALDWNKWVFFTWYLFGAALNAAWLGHGTLYLMVKKKWRTYLTIALVSYSLFATVLMVQAIGNLNEALYKTEIPVSEQYGTKVTAYDSGDIIPENVVVYPAAFDCATETFTSDGPVPANYTGSRLAGDCKDMPGGTVLEYQMSVELGLLPYGTSVRTTTPFLNIYGLLTLVGGAIYSAYLFWRKRVLPNRVVANVLIAAGALLIGGASVLTRLGYGQFLYIGELFSAILMFWGFIIASKPQPNEIPAPAAASATD